MIVFPNLSNYISDYKNTLNVITIVIYEYPDKMGGKYFNVSTPFPYDVFIEMLQNLIDQRELTNLRIEQIKYQCNIEKINIWQLAWYINNIRKNRIANVTIHRKDNSDITYKFNADDEQSVKKFIRIIRNNSY